MYFNFAAIAMCTLCELPLPIPQTSLPQKNLVIMRLPIPHFHYAEPGRARSIWFNNGFTTPFTRPISAILTSFHAVRLTGAQVASYTLTDWRLMTIINWTMNLIPMNN